MIRPRSVNRSVNEACKDLRTLLGLTQQAFALRTNVSIQTVQRWEGLSPLSLRSLVVLHDLARSCRRDAYVKNSPDGDRCEALRRVFHEQLIAIHPDYQTDFIGGLRGDYLMEIKTLLEELSEKHPNTDLGRRAKDVLESDKVGKGLSLLYRLSTNEKEIGTA